MKKKIYLKTTIMALTALSLFSGCLKDPRYVNYSGVGVLIELPLAEPNLGYQFNASNGPFQTLTYDITSTSTDTLTVAVNVASPKPLTSALSVTLSATDVTALNAYNTANGTSYVALPASDYTVVGGLTVTVPANQRLAYAKIVINAGAIGVLNSGNYVLPITIESASGQTIALPEKSLLYNIIVTGPNQETAGIH
jgi:hypothetical protein